MYFSTYYSFDIYTKSSVLSWKQAEGLISLEPRVCQKWPVSCRDDEEEALTQLAHTSEHTPLVIYRFPPSHWIFVLWNSSLAPLVQTNSTDSDKRGQGPWFTLICSVQLRSWILFCVYSTASISSLCNLLYFLGVVVCWLPSLFDNSKDGHHGLKSC